jgi:hypothetical protein
MSPNCPHGAASPPQRRSPRPPRPAPGVPLTSLHRGLGWLIQCPARDYFPVYVASAGAGGITTWNSPARSSGA